MSGSLQNKLNIKFVANSPDANYDGAEAEGVKQERPLLPLPSMPSNYEENEVDDEEDMPTPLIIRDRGNSTFQQYLHSVFK